MNQLNTHHTFTIESTVIRLLASWILISLVNSLGSDAFLTLAFCASESIPVFVLKVLLCFLTLSALDWALPGSPDVPALLGGTLLYSLRIVRGSNDVGVLLAVCLFTAFVLYYFFPRLPLTQLRILFSARVCHIFIAVCAILLFFYICAVTISRYCLSRSSTFDMGIFIQMFYNMKENLTMYTTCERNEWLSHTSVHTSVFFYLLLPVYWLFPYAKTLLVLQAGAVLLGFVPLFALCRHMQLSAPYTLGFCLLYGLSPATTGGCFYDFHENVFLLPLLLALFYFYETRRWLPMICFALLVCSVKEDATLFVLVFAGFVLLSRRDVRPALCLFGIGAVCMALAFSYLSVHGQGLMTNHYSNLVCDDTIGLFGILQTLLNNPGYLMTQLFTEDKLNFAITVFAPLSILPFYTRKYSRFLLLFPFFFINLLPSYTYQHSVFYQYVFGPYMFLLYLSLMNLRELNPRPKQALLLLCLCCSLYCFTSQILDRSYYLSDYRFKQTERTAVSEMLSQIPEDASVSATTFYVPQLAQRKTIYMLDKKILESQTIYETDYAVFDLRNGFADETVDEQIELYQEQGYESIAEESGVYCLLKRP